MKVFNFHVFPKSDCSKYYRGFLIDVTQPKNNPPSKDFENENKKDLWNDVVKYLESKNSKIKLKCNDSVIILNIS